MFCSKCGKTIPAGATVCTHCQTVIGSGEFSAASYIASLPADQPSATEESAEKPRYSRFTRTSYTTMEDDGGGDVVRRTTYRPVLEEEPAGEEPAPEEPAADELAAKQEQKPADEPEAPAPNPVGDPAELPEDMQIQPFKPVKLPGISPQTQERMRRLAEQEDGAAEAGKPSRPVISSLFSNSRRAEKTRVPKREPVREEPAEDETASAPAAEADSRAYYEDEEEVFDTSDIEEEEEADRRSFLSFFRSREREPLSRSASILRTVVLAALVVAILIGGFVWLSLRTAAKSQVTGVTSSLFERGVALIESHTTTQYRDRIVATYTEDPTGTAALEMQTADRAEITALLPGTPLANDQEFVNTLLSIQDQIDNAVTLDALSSLAGGGVDLGGSSEERWSAIRAAVQRLKSASSATEFSSIAQSAVLTVTPSPSPEPTVSPYTTLTKGMKDNEDVRAMQARLYELGWFNEPRDGDFGPLTQTAVKEFQQAAGLTVTGIADPETLAAIYAEDAPRTGSRITPPPAAPDVTDAQVTVAPAETAAPASPNG